MRRLIAATLFVLLALALHAETPDPFAHWFGSTTPCEGNATLSVQLPPGHTGIVYVPRQVVSCPATERTTVPAGEELWLFVLAAKNTPEAVFVIPAIDAEKERAVDARGAMAKPVAVGWVHLPWDDQQAMKRAHGMALPKIRVTSGGKDIEASSLPSPEKLDTALVLFPGVTQGNAPLQLSGRGWLPLRSGISVGSQPVTLVRSPIIARASATLIVSWSAQRDLAELDRSLGSCDPPQAPHFDLTISSCVSPRSGEPFDPAKCQAIRKDALALDAPYGDATLDQLVPGLYMAELRFGKLPVVRGTVNLLPLDQKPLSLVATYVTLYGSLTRGGKPLNDDARIEFPNGGLGFSPSDGSDYRAIFVGRSNEVVGDDAKVDIITCHGARTYVLTDRAVLRNTRLDIDIPNNVLTVKVIDTFTHEALPSPTLKYVVMSRATPRVPRVTRTFQASEADGPSFVIRDVPEREIHLEVTHRGYKKQNVEPFTMSKSDRKEVVVELVPVSGSEGKIVSSHPFERGTVIWTTTGGAETERAELAPDGTFNFEQPHYRDETMTVVSASHPLWIVRAPLVERRKPLEVRFPDGAPVRAVDVYIEGIAQRFVTLAGVTIGGLRVPAAAFALHQSLRDDQPLVHGSGPLHLAALAETGPIEILRGPTVMPVVAAQAVREFVPVAKEPLRPNAEKVIFGPR